MLQRNVPLGLRVARRSLWKQGALRKGQRFDEAEMMAEQLNHGTYKAKRSKLDYQWSDKSPRQLEQEYADKVEKMQKLMAVFQGLAVVVGIGVAGTVYLQWPQIKGWILARDRRVDDNTLERLKEIKRKKELRGIPEIPVTAPQPGEPGLYYWGARLGEDAGSTRFPLRVPGFEGERLRDVALAEEGCNLAIDRRGDLYAWTTRSRELLLPGQDLCQVQISNGVAYGLRGNGDLLVIPYTDRARLAEHASWRRSLLMPWSRYCVYDWKVDSGLLARGEKRVVKFATGKRHLVAVTDRGHVYTCATGLENDAGATSCGQFGVPEYSKFDGAPPVNQLLEVELLNKTIAPDGQLVERTITHIACGNYHTLAIDSKGELYAFGANTYGQLGLPVTYDLETVPFPRRIANFGAHFMSGAALRCVDIHCCGETSFVSVVPQTGGADMPQQLTYFSFGNGIWGQLGNGRFKHSQNEATKLKAVNGIYDHPERDVKRRVKIATWACGDHHVLCSLDNGDVLAWGYNDRGQLGNGRGVKWAQPQNVPALLAPGVNYARDPEGTLFAPNNRMQLLPDQRLAAGPAASCIYWQA
ncbi:ABR238Wp [Eremothecium gossypii ATCC 10895]|uniref:ABR238Wp n=1 Tax=Eremothecium gossypii (strain ATCC 10895 / CBS 109.51 / FGSC 9923 / NRRL Y-1056) TaxID=284811 RepID=Q75CY4_EREGS|nr:ABR238Wp [Eremothecium gossypii ATCC 10895]AAS51011.2 ABR238Wp [Eremothecium gossypii ATCC 10895]